MIERLKYFARRTVRDFSSTLLLNMLNIFTVFIAMLILSSFVLLFHNIERLLARQEGDIKVSVYLIDGLSSSSVGEIEKSIRSREGVSAVDFVGKETAKKIFTEWNRKIGHVVESMGENPFPASFEVRVSPDYREREKIAALAGVLSRIKGVETVDYSSEWYDKLSSFVTALRGIGIFLIVFLCAAAVFLISNTIRLKVYTQRDEIGIMRIVGATDFFIKTPFIIEGVLAGLLGSLLSVGMLFAVFRMFSPGLESSLTYLVGRTGMAFIPSGYIYWILGLGTGVGFFGSDSAVRKHLRSEV